MNKRLLRLISKCTNIPYPKKICESEIKSILYNQFHNIGIDARLEVAGPNSRYDIVIFKNHKARIIIECKSWNNNYYEKLKKARNYTNKQIRKYKSTGFEVFTCGNIRQIPKTISIIKNKISNIRQ